MKPLFPNFPQRFILEVLEDLEKKEDKAGKEVSENCRLAVMNQAKMNKFSSGSGLLEGVDCSNVVNYENLGTWWQLSWAEIVNGVGEQGIFRYLL